MAERKKDARPADERAAPIENILEETAEDRHIRLRAERRALETELAEVDGKIRTAIQNGDLKALEELTPRKAELPKLFMAASIAETNARHEVFNAEDGANSQNLVAAIAERDRLQAALVKKQQEAEAEIAALKNELQAADQTVSGLYANIGAARNLGATNDAGFHRSLAKLAGV